MSSVRAAANSISLSMNHTARRRASAAWATRNGFQGSAADAGEVSSSGSSRIAGKMALSLEPAKAPDDRLGIAPEGPTEERVH